MIEYKKLPETMSVDCSAHGFGSFYVLIVPVPDSDNFTFYLAHPQYSTIMEMFGCTIDNPEQAAEMAYNNALDYMADFIRCCID